MRNGPRPLVRFPNGNTYVGEWLNDMMHGTAFWSPFYWTAVLPIISPTIYFHVFIYVGKGTLKSLKEGTEYYGDFSNGKKEGFGILSCITDLSLMDNHDPTLKSNQNKTATLPDNVPMRKVYVGFWSEDMFHGEGTLYGGDEKSFYQGQFITGLKHGFGREQNAKGDVYDGAWQNNLKNGKGTAKFTNGDIYEGMWFEGKKHGPGKYIYTDKGRVYEGEWVSDVAKFGQMSDLDDGDRKESSTTHSIPQLTLASPEEVLAQARQEVIDKANK